MSTTTDPTDERKKWRAFWVAVAVAGVTILDLSKVNVALPSIESALGAGSTELQVIVSGYVLTFGLALVPMGRLGDQRSRRTLFIIGLSLFTLTSLICALAPNATVLLIGRLLQGIAAGIQMPQVLGLIQSQFQGKERGRAFGLFGATIGICTAIGPTLGGLLIALGGEPDGWRLIFWMNVPLCVIAIGLAIFLLPDTRPATKEPLHLDPVGVVLLGGTILCLLLPFLLTTGGSDDDPRRWWSLVGFVLLAAALVAWERHYAAQGRSPLIPFKLFGISSFRNGTLLVAIYFTALPSMFLTTTLFLQEGVGLTPLLAGLVGMGFAIVSATASYVGGGLVGRIGRPLVIGGLVIMLCCTVGMSLVAHFVPQQLIPFALAAVMLLGGVGGGVVVSPNQTLTLADVPVSQGGLAGSMGQLGQRIGTAIGTAVTLSLFYAAVYSTQGEPGLDAYRDAYNLGMVAVSGFIALALLIGVIDAGSRQRRARPTPVAQGVDSPG
ncbi:MFS transporter [Naumannella halotolerans]|uniref:MFS transporter n=1 Tax=Naumannella halotolerans TaxID=993414 RepID=A0A4R7J9Q2_9ACTN|nr:MFS transporter [Naumannella halotolerans]TDT34260.1 MFS transporter [Naumannella halotolerans]